MVFRDVSARRQVELERERLQAELAAKARELQTIFDIAPMQVWVADAECKSIRGNRRAYEAHGLEYGINASFDAPVSELPSGLRLEAAGRTLQPEEMPMPRAARSGEAILGFEHDVVHADGRRICMIANVAPLHDASGAVAGVVGCYLDITERKRAEAALREALQQLQVVTESMSISVTRCSRNLTYRWVNQPFANWVGKPREQIIGRSIAKILGDDAFGELQPYFRQVLSGEQIRFERDVEYPGVGRRWINAIYTPTLDSAGATDGWVEVIIDLTERKAIEQASPSEERFRQLAEAMPHIVWTADASGSNDYMSQHWTEYTGLPVEQGLSDRWAESIHVEDRPALLSQWHECIQDGQPYTAEYRLRAKDGSYRWQLVRAVPIFNDRGEVVKWYGTSTDIHEQKKLTEALAEADRHKNHFLATLAHELRNPLAALNSSIDLLQYDIGRTHEFDQTRGIMSRQLAQLVRLVDDLLDLNRIARGKIQIRKERVELAEMVGRAVEAARPLIDAMGHDLVVTLPSQPVYLDADPLRLSQIISNLLNNAAKYTEKTGSIRLMAELAGAETLISVRDNGIGIAPEQLPHVFEMFAQVASARSQSQGGLGIGLSLVRRAGGTPRRKRRGAARAQAAVVNSCSDCPSPRRLRPVPANTIRTYKKVLRAESRDESCWPTTTATQPTSWPSCSD